MVDLTEKKKKRKKKKAEKKKRRNGKPKKVSIAREPNRHFGIITVLCGPRVNTCATEETITRNANFK